MMPYSGDRGRSPPPHPQPHATLSYLSPSATPFTAARARATTDPIPNAPANPSPYPELPTAPSLYDSWVEPPATYMDPVSSAPPGYTGFPVMLSESAPDNIYPGNHFGTSMQPHPFTTGGSEWMQEKYPGNYQRTSKALSSDFGSSVVHQPSLPHNMLDCLDRKPCSTPQPVNPYTAYSYDTYLSQFPSCSTYPLNSDLSLLSVAASPEVCASTKAVPSTTDGHVFDNAFSSPYTNPCRLNLDYFDTMQNEQKDLVGYQTAYKHYGDWSTSDNGPTIAGNYRLRSHRVGENYLIDESSGTGRAVQPLSEVKSGLKNLQSSYSKGFPPELAFAQHHDLFTEPSEVNNLVVDSPCWKGTPTVQKPSFAVQNDEAPYSASGTSDLHDQHQSKNLPEFISNNSVLFSKHDDTSNAENDTCLPHCKNYLSAFSLPSECKKSEGYSETEPSSVGTFNGMDKCNHPCHVSFEQSTRRDKHMTCTTGDDSKTVVTEGQQGSVFPVNVTSESIVLGRNISTGSLSEESVREVPFTVRAAPTADIRSPAKESPQRNTSCTHKPAATWENLCSDTNRGLGHLTHCSPVVQEDLVKVSSDKVTYRSKTQAGIIKSMHSLSVTLLSTCNGSYELEESEHALVQSVIQNLNSLSLRKAALKVEDVNSNCCQRKPEKMMCNGSTCQPGKFAELDSENIGADFKTSIVQDLNKPREDNVVGDTKDEQMLVYKNLWIEAEASMCKLKYDLQLTRMKLAMKCQGQQSDNPVSAAFASSPGEAKASNLTKHDNPFCVGELNDLSKLQNSLVESNIYSATLPQGGASCDGDGQSPEVNRNITDKVDAAVFARLKVLKIRDENINSFYEDNCELQKETCNYNKTDSVGDSVIDNADDDRLFSLVEEIIKDSPGASKSKGDGADDAFLAILKEFMSCNNNTCSLDENVDQELPNSSKNKADGAAVARFKDLMCSGDNISSSGEDNACQPQISSNNESARFKDGVMARLQVLKRRIDNTSSAVEGEQEIFHSDDWAACITREARVTRERIGSAASTEAHDGLIEKTKLSDDVKCTTLSDDVNAKTAEQHLSTLLEESHILPGPIEPGGLHLHNEQSSQSPSEWEHVLKEDFFLPGNP